MARITITVPAEFFSKLQAEAQQKKCSLSQYAAQLLYAGIQASGCQTIATQQAESAETMPMLDSQQLWQHDLAWSLEHRYLLRYLIEHILPNQTEKNAAALSLAKEKAQRFVEALLAHQSPT